VRAVVTGSSGFVGRHLVAALRARGAAVTGLDRSGPDPIDVSDAEAVRMRLHGIRPDVVFHLAAASHVGDSWADPARAFRINAEGALNVLRACHGLGAGRILLVGSAEEYGKVDPADLPLSEIAPLRPLTPYGAAKVAADYLGLQAFLADGLPVVRVRPFSHTGPGQSARFVVPALAGRVATAEREGSKAVRVGALDPVRDLTDVRDVVRAYLLLAEHGVPGEVYNVCRGTGVAVREVAETLISHAESELRLEVDPELVRPVEVPVLVGDPSKLTAATGWLPEVPMAQTLADVLAEARAALG